MTYFNCDKSTLSRAILMLQNLGFINKKRFFVRNDDKDDNRHDKSLWTISLLLPSSIQQELTKQKDRASSSSNYIAKNRQYSLVKDSLDADSTPAIITEIAHTDPYVANSSQYYNKEEKINIKDIDSIDSNEKCFEKVNISLPETSSELSEFYKNSLEEERVEKIEKIEEISEIVKEEQEKTLLLNQLSEQSGEEEQINVAIENGLVNTTSEISVTNASIVHHKKSSSQAKSLPNNKPSTQATSLKSFYPLSKEQVDKINKLSSREFSSNFANQLLLKLYIRDPNKTFASTNHMIAYMSKAFRYEKHQAPMVNHETFRFTANVSDPESVEMRQKEKYLSE
ncbi:MAG: hypothetical protein QMO91_02450, partial [Candidatus Tisiphia sp.]|nr:hypothetical protein [Candidatus Tisiphia sp.]